MQKKRPSMIHKIGTRQKKMLNSTQCSREDKTNLFCMKRFLPDVNKSVEEDMREVLRRRIAAMCFNECNRMAFHELSLNKVATATQI